MRLNSETSINTEDELSDFVELFSRTLILPFTIGFDGPLGAGKTTFVRYLTRALGSPDVVTSPTYALQNEYFSPTGSIEHWDLYRLSSIPDELLEPPSEGTIRLIEWPHRGLHIDMKIDISFSRSAQSGKRDELVDGVRIIKIYTLN